MTMPTFNVTFNKLRSCWNLLCNHKIFLDPFTKKFQFFNCFDWDIICIDPITGKIQIYEEPDSLIVFQCDCGVWSSDINLSPGSALGAKGNYELILEHNSFSQLIIIAANELHNLYGYSDTKREVRKKSRKFTSKTLYAAWLYLYRHPIFLDGYGNTRFHDCSIISLRGDNTGSPDWQTKKFILGIKPWDKEAGKFSAQKKCHEDNDLAVEGRSFEEMIYLLTYRLLQKYSLHLSQKKVFRNSHLQQ